MEKTKPLYITIIEDFRRKIEQGELSPNMKLPSESELAQLYGVSRITSKRALLELERERLIYKIKGSGSYVLERKGKSEIITKNNLNIIGMVLPFGSSEGRGIDLIQGAGDYLESKSFLLSVQICNRDSNREKEIIKSFINTGVTGIIYYPNSSSKNMDLLYALLLDNFPIVTVDRYFESIPINYVVSDNFKATYDSVTYLIKKGHKNIGFIADHPLEQATSIRERFFGYCNALKKNQLEINDNYCIINFLEWISNDRLSLQNDTFSKYDESEYFKVLLNKLLDRNDRVTAIQALNDYNAIRILRTASSLGVKVPDELSIIGFDNIDASQHIDIPLTTIEQEFYKIGYKAAEILISNIFGEQCEQQKVVLPTKFIERNSVWHI